MGQLGGYTKKMYNESHCSPSSDNNNNSCLDDELILKVSKIVNKLTKDKKDFEEIDTNLPINEMHNELCKVLHKMTGCSSEACWMNIKKLMKQLGKDAENFKDKFRPIMPDKWIKDYNTWLRTSDIEECLEQYEHSHKNFYFYGAVPIDFSDCPVSNLCSFDLDEHLNNKKNKIGIVFNTDPHDEPGQHWISLYVDILGRNIKNTPAIYYFDSYGEKPTTEIQDLIDKIKKQGKNRDIDFKYLYNDYPYQKKNYQCGMYSIYFINEMLRDISFKNFLNQELTDKRMENKRKEYFIPPEEIKCKYNL